MILGFQFLKTPRLMGLLFLLRGMALATMRLVVTLLWACQRIRGQALRVTYLLRQTLLALLIRLQTSALPIVCGAVRGPIQTSTAQIFPLESNLVRKAAICGMWIMSRSRFIILR